MAERKAEHWKRSEGGAIRCELCPQRCLISKGGTGLCGVRRNREGELVAESYGIYPAVHLDPVEKKPLNHFLPGSTVLSLGSVGCNLTCLHCQNHSLARGAVPLESQVLTPAELAGSFHRGGSVGVAFTYNEPTINYEFILDSAPLIRKRGGKVIMVTNGFLSPGPWRDVMELTDGANIDVKGFTEDFYRRVTGGRLQPVLENVKTAHGMGVHIELTYLVIPGYNDNMQEVSSFMEWVKDDLDPGVPVHFNRFHPDHRMMDVPATPSETLESIGKKALTVGLVNVFVGNLVGSGFEDTTCPGCGKTLVSRTGFFVKVKGIENGRCTRCGKEIYGVWS